MAGEAILVARTMVGPGVSSARAGSAVPLRTGWSPPSGEVGSHHLTKTKPLGAVNLLALTGCYQFPAEGPISSEQYGLPAPVNVSTLRPHGHRGP